VIQSLLSLYNPWWSNKNWKINGISREIFDRFFISIKEKPYITVLKGTRQCGKTFLLKQCVSTLLKREVDPQNIFYFLLDDLELSRYIEENPNEFVNYLRNEARVKGKLYIFLDEFQKVSNITNVIKLFYEFSSDLKFILTGSSSLQIADQISESLLGRTETFILTPFSFKEFLSSALTDAPFSFPYDESTERITKFLLNAKNNFENLKKFYSNHHFIFDSIINNYLPCYLLTGGYPQAVLSNSSTDAFLRLKEIKQTFVEKDIVNLLRIEKLKEFDKLLRVLSLQTGILLNYHDLQTAVGINYQTLMIFFNILEATYLWSTLPVYTSNKITSIKKRPKSFFSDVGLRNFLASTFDQTQLEKEKGAVAENYVFCQLTNYNLRFLNGMGQLYFWRSPDGNEVDFLLEYGKIQIPIEVKYQQSQQIKITRGLQTFLKRQNYKYAIVFTHNILELKKINDIQYYMIPLALLSGI